MSEDHEPDRRGGRLELEPRDDGTLQFASRDPLTGAFDFCMHLRQDDAHDIGHALVAWADAQPIPDDVEAQQERTRKAFAQGQDSIVNILRSLRQSAQRDTTALPSMSRRAMAAWTVSAIDGLLVTIAKMRQQLEPGEWPSKTT